MSLYSHPWIERLGYVNWGHPDRRLQWSTSSADQEDRLSIDMLRWVENGLVQHSPPTEFMGRGSGMAEGMTDKWIAQLDGFVSDCDSIPQVVTYPRR